jgi:CBS domain-containing protein
LGASPGLTRAAVRTAGAALNQLYPSAYPDKIGDMKRRVPISQILTTEVVTVDRNQPLSEVYHMLRSAPFHHVPVMERDRPVGMVSSVDVLKLAYDTEGFDDKAMTAMLDYQFSIEDAMTAELLSLPPNASVQEAAEMLSDGKAHSVLVVDEDGKLHGIVTTTDLVRFLRDL